MRLFKYILLFLFSIASSSANASGLDGDNDGVPDELDKCPDTAQLKKLPADFKFASAVNSERLILGSKAYPVDTNGCEFDSDGDLVVNSQDYCPQDSQLALSKGIAINGCPRHSDFDGTPDYRDKCPDTPKETKADKNGCPI